MYLYIYEKKYTCWNRKKSAT